MTSRTEPIRSEFKNGELTKLYDVTKGKLRSEINAIIGTDTSKRTISNTLLRMETAIADFTDESGLLTFMAYVSNDRAIREEANACEEDAGRLMVEIATSKELYEAIKDTRPENMPRNEDERRLHSQTLKDFRRNGLDLSDEQLALFRERMKRLSDLCIRFRKNIDEDNVVAEFTGKELEGCPGDFLNRLKRTEDGNRFVVTTRAADYQTVMENAISSRTRYRMMTAYMSRAAGVNPEVLTEVLSLRRSIAEMLGYKHWADYQTEDRMAKNAESVHEFLTDLKAKLAERVKKDIERFREYLRKSGDNEEFGVWDVSYAVNQIMKSEYQVDDEAIRPYFPSDQTAQAIFDVYSEILGIRLVEVKNVRAWDKSVKLYEIRGAGASDEVLAFLYTDLYPREGKYSHFAAFNLVNGRVMADGSYSKPVSVIVGNFNPPGAEGLPSLMKHDEVETFFHEFGHIMHQTLTRAPYSSLSGTNVARDFVEAPSQMFEEWAWNPEILKRVSGHYKTGEKLPDQMIAKMIAARRFGSGAYFHTKQLVYGLFDMTLHMSRAALTESPDEVYRQLHLEAMGLDLKREWSFASGFGHLTGYSAGYYGYLWSKVYAIDMAARFQADGMTNPRVGAEYRKAILEPGNMSDAMELIRRFLGREPSNEAFFKQIGID